MILGYCPNKSSAGFNYLLNAIWLFLTKEQKHPHTSVGAMFLTKWYSILLLLCMLTYSDGDSELEEKIEKNIKKGEESKNILTDLIKNMKKDPSTSSKIPGNSDSVGVKIKKAGKKWVKATAEAYNADKEGNADRISGAISGAGEGLVGMVNGIKNNDWKEGVQGALQIVSTIAAMAGPMGMIASSVLSFISSLFDLFGGSEKTESMDDKLERIVGQEIDKGREKDLKADVEGMKLTYQSISGSVQHFRESKKLKVDQANEMYNLVFEAIPVIGKLRARIDDICDNVTSYEDAEKCLTAVNMYSDVSILRQLVLTDMASLLADVNDFAFDKEGEKNTTEDVTGLLVVGNNILHVIKKEQESDGNFLRFMTDPFNVPKRRYAIAIFFALSEKYPSLKAYIRALDDILDDGMFKDYVMMCRKARLQGECNILEKDNYSDLSADPEEWKNSIASLYIPLGAEVIGYDNTGYEGTKYGPFVGPAALTEIKGGSVWDSIKVQNTTRDADEEVKICEIKNREPRFCDTVRVGVVNKLKGYHGVNWEQRIRSMFIPKGLAVHGHTDVNKGGEHYYYFVGSQIINDVYSFETWKSMEVITRAGAGDASEHVWFCDGNGLGGHCRTAWYSVNDLDNYIGTKFAKKIKSLKIPGGVYVTGYSKTNYKGARYGPYTGPATIPTAEPENKWVSFKITKFGVLQKNSME